MMSGLSRKFTQTKINNRNYELIVNSGLHFIFVRDKNFIELLQYLQPTVKTLVLCFYDNVHRDVSDEEVIESNLNLNWIMCVCHLWLSVANKSYFGMMNHYVGEDLNMESVALACSRVSGSHTWYSGQNHWKLTKELLHPQVYACNERQWQQLCGDFQANCFYCDISRRKPWWSRWRI